MRQFLDIAGELFTVAVGDPVTRSGGPEVVGYMLASPPGQEQLTWLLSLAVDSTYRRVGIGRRLMLRTLAICRSRGASRVRCTVRPDNRPMLSLARSLNFAEVDEDPHYFGRGKSRKVLELSVS